MHKWLDLVCIIFQCQTTASHHRKYNYNFLLHFKWLELDCYWKCCSHQVVGHWVEGSPDGHGVRVGPELQFGGLSVQQFGGKLLLLVVLVAKGRQQELVVEARHDEQVGKRTMSSFSNNGWKWSLSQKLNLVFWFEKQNNKNFCSTPTVRGLPAFQLSCALFKKIPKWGCKNTRTEVIKKLKSKLLIDNIKQIQLVILIYILFMKLMPNEQN